MNHKKPTIEEYLELSPQLQHYYRTNYPELNYPLPSKLKNDNKPSLEEFKELPYYLRKKWSNLYPNDYPKAKKYKYNVKD